MQTLQDHFGEALAAQGRGDTFAAGLHDGVVTAALGETSTHHIVCLPEERITTISINVDGMEAGSRPGS